MYDFEGWATKNDLRCADGRIIKKDAFRVNDKTRVPLVWNHQHNDVSGVLGHADLENRNEGVYARCSFNDTPGGRQAKEAVKHGDVTALSIWANQVDQVGNNVVHGNIKEVSLVLAGANPGAYIESVISHGYPMDDEEAEGIIYTNESIIICHNDEVKKPEQDKGEESLPEKKTVRQVIDNLSDEEKAAVAVLLEQVVKNQNEDDLEEEDPEMKHNAFDATSELPNQIISHSDMKTILSDAKQMGSLKAAFQKNIEDGVLSHSSIDTTGMEVPTGVVATYGLNDPSMLFPDYRTLVNTPEFISRNMDWVAKVMNKVHHSPFSRVKSVFADITADEARARGYIKGKQKVDEVIALLKRTTDPQMVYKRQKMDRDDIIDIEAGGFDVLRWIAGEMRIMLNEEIARAILIGDGRSSASDDKIKEDRIRNITKEPPLFNTIIKVTVPADATNEMVAKETIKAMIRGRKYYSGSGRPDFYTTEDVVTEMLLIENQIGESVYKTEAELATKIRVNEIIPVEPMEGHTITVTEGETTKAYPLIGVVVNLADYNVGTDKGGEINMFDAFDIDFNQQKYLLETKLSGALIKPFSALTIVLDKPASRTSSLAEG